MNNRILARDIGAHCGKQVTVCGWAHRIRDLGGVSFVLLRDRSGVVQLVCEGSVNMSLESVVCVEGTVAQSDKAPGGYEVRFTSEALRPLATAEMPLPYTPHAADGVGLESTLDHRILSLRAPRINAVFRIQAAIITHFARYMRSREFTEIKSSKLVAGGTEGGSGLFRVEYFDRSLFLAQSPQFYKQAMVASGMERVFEIGTAYRAEKHETARHLNEYVSLDVEWGFIDSIDSLIDIEVEILAAIAAGVRADCAPLIDAYQFPIPEPDTLRRAPRIDYQSALGIIANETTDKRRVFEINPEGERLLSQWALRTHQTALVFVFGFPLRKRPFYTYPDGSATKSFDCIFRGVEITTGGLRIHHYQQLKDNLARFGLRAEDLSYYLDIFRYGCPPHGGFAIGLERLTQKFCALDNVKEASLFPRDRSRITP